MAAAPDQGEELGLVLHKPPQAQAQPLHQQRGGGRLAHALHCLRGGAAGLHHPARQVSLHAVQYANPEPYALDSAQWQNQPATHSTTGLTTCRLVLSALDSTDCTGQYRLDWAVLSLLDDAWRPDLRHGKGLEDRLSVMALHTDTWIGWLLMLCPERQATQVKSLRVSCPCNGQAAAISTSSAWRGRQAGCSPWTTAGRAASAGAPAPRTRGGRACARRR